MKLLQTCSFFLFFYCISLISCTFSEDSIINETDFVTIYAHLSIINELNVSQDYHDKLVEELLVEFNIQVSDIQKTVDFYQQKPREWLLILEKVKNKIDELKKKNKESEKPRY